MGVMLAARFRTRQSPEANRLAESVGLNKTAAVNVMMLLEMASGAMGDRVAIGRLSDGITYQQLFDRAAVGAQTIRDAGVERTVMLDTTSEALPIAVFAAAWAGTPFVPLNYRLTAPEIAALGAEIAPALAVCGADYSSLIASVDGVNIVERDDFLTEVATTEAVQPDEWATDPSDIAILLFTSGTTGAPKAAVLRHQHLVSYIIGSVEFMGAGEEEAALVSVPPYHVASMASIFSSVYAGRRVIQMPNFDADDWIDTARSEGVTHAMVVPTMLARIVERLVERNLEGIPTLRALSYGGGKMPAPIIERALELMPTTNFVNAYGLTETSSTICLLGPEDHRVAVASDDPAVRRRLSSVGQPLPTVEVEIRDEEGHQVEAGTSGEIWVRGEQVSGEYLGRESKIADGWFPTHDGGSFDEDGYLYVEGRIDDIIVRGGENISPGEIELVLMDHPAIDDAAAIGTPDEQWGEAVAAVVVCRKGETVSIDQLSSYVRERLRSSRTPDRIEFRDELPYNETGKLLRRVLRQELAAPSTAPEESNQPNESE